MDQQILPSQTNTDTISGEFIQGEVLQGGCMLGYFALTDEEIEDIFRHHPPTPEQVEMYQQVRSIFTESAKKLAALMPPGPGRAVAIRSLAQSQMAVNSAIALEGKF